MTVGVQTRSRQVVDDRLDVAPAGNERVGKRVVRGLPSFEMPKGRTKCVWVVWGRLRLRQSLDGRDGAARLAARPQGSEGSPEMRFGIDLRSCLDEEPKYGELAGLVFITDGPDMRSGARVEGG